MIATLILSDFENASYPSMSESEFTSPKHAGTGHFRRSYLKGGDMGCYLVSRLEETLTDYNISICNLFLEQRNILKITDDSLKIGIIRCELSCLLLISHHSSELCVWVVG